MSGILLIGFFLFLIILRLWANKDKIFQKKTGKGLYYVYNTYGSGPKYVHQSYESALNEAKRLARKHPRVDFEILEIVQKIEATPACEFISDDEIPF